MSARMRARPNIQTAPRQALKMPFGLRPLEIVIALATLISIILVVYYYISTLQPEQERLASLERQEAELDNLLVQAKEKIDKPVSEDPAQMALDSLNAFKDKRLKPQLRGEVALYDDINALAKKHGLQLISGIEMSRQADTNQEEAASQKKGEEILKVYPETNIRFTVAGEYQNLRTFISVLEQNQQFLLVNSLNLLRVDKEEGGRGGRGGGSSGIALSIEMTAYFHP